MVLHALKRCTITRFGKAHCGDMKNGIREKIEGSLVRTQFNGNVRRLCEQFGGVNKFITKTLHQNYDKGFG
jgi:hypothetical protein